VASRVAHRRPGDRHGHVLQFIQIWDDLLVGLLFIQNTSERPITVDWPCWRRPNDVDSRVDAGSIISALPAMLVYLASSVTS